MASQDGVVEDPGPDDPVVAGQDPGDVLDALPLVDADLVAPDGDGVAAEADDSHLGGVAGPGRRLLEDQRHPAAGQDLGRVGDLRPGRGRRRRARLGVEVVDLEEVSHHGAHPLGAEDAGSRMATASSISSSVTSSDGASRSARRR